MKSLGNFLMAASSLFFIETAFEMYLLTLVHSQQMLFYSLAHSASIFLLLVVLSGLAFACLAVFAVGVIVLHLVGRPNIEKRYARMMLVILLVQLAHMALLLTYDRWAAWFS